MLNPAFSFQILNGFIGTFNELSLDCVAKLEEMLETVQDQEFDVFPIMYKLALDILSGNEWNPLDYRISAMRLIFYQFYFDYKRNFHGTKNVERRGNDQLRPGPWRVSYHFDLPIFLFQTTISETYNH